MRAFYYIFILFLTLCLNACQEGLTPEFGKKEANIYGKLIVVSGINSWPPPDSALELRVVAFKEYPPKDIIGEILSGNAYFTDTLPRFVDTIPFSLKIDTPPVELKYIVGALRYGSILEWKVIGVYTTDTSSKNPTSIYVKRGDVINDVNIFVDFYNLPKQPF
jgi:hypothetical protein